MFEILNLCLQEVKRQTEHDRRLPSEKFEWSQPVSAGSNTCRQERHRTHNKLI